MLARWVSELFGTNYCHSLLAVTHASAWLFWIYALGLLRLWKLPFSLSAAAIAALLVYPSSFFIVVGYSEPLFMAALFGFFYWFAKARTTRHWVLAAGHGVLLTATRLAGVPVVFAPALASGFAWPWLAVGAAGSLGAFGFFAFCSVKFGHWDLYMQTAKIGWNVYSDYSAIYQWRLYWPTSAMVSGVLKGDAFAFSKIAVPLTAAQFLLMAFFEGWNYRRLREKSRWRQRVAFYAGAWVMFHLNVCARLSLDMMGMIRYTLPTYGLLVLAAVHLAQDAWLLSGTEPGRLKPLSRFLLWALFSAIFCALLLGQWVLASKFMRHEWSA